MHQWTTPPTPVGQAPPAYPKGVSVSYVPDMPQPTANDGTLTFYYTNQQSARLMFYHDHAYGITRLNVYAGMAAGYLIQDVGGTGEWTLPGFGAMPQIPLVIQDKTFAWGTPGSCTTPPTGATLGTGTYATDPLFVCASPNAQAGDLWFPHVYVTNQWPNNPDGSGANPYGRWDWGPWFWPVFPAPNPVPSLSTTPEAFMDTPVVNGTVYPYLQVAPKAYRFRILNACNDRFLNLQLYYADPSGTEVAMVPRDGFRVQGPDRNL